MAQLLEKPYFPRLATEDRFRALADEFCSAAALEGVKIRSYREESWDRFRSMAPEIQTAKTNAFLNYYKIWAEEGLGLRRGVRTLERTISKLGFKACPMLSESLSEEDIIESYSSDLTQLYRNLKFLEICSYPITELYMYEWTELYRRPHVITQKLIEDVQRTLSDTGPYLETRKCEVPDHFLEEIFSPERHRFFIEQGIISPLRGPEGKIDAFVCSLKATILSPSEDNVPFNVRPLSK